MGAGAVRPSLPFSLPFTQNNLRQPISENFCSCQPFCGGCLYEKKMKKIWSPSERFAHKREG